MVKIYAYAAACKKRRKYGPYIRTDTLLRRRPTKQRRALRSLGSNKPIYTPSSRSTQAKPHRDRPNAPCGSGPSWTPSLSLSLSLTHPTPRHPPPSVVLLQARAPVLPSSSRDAIPFTPPAAGPPPATVAAVFPSPRCTFIYMSTNLPPYCQPKLSHTLS
ncbi:hypothetical protein GUJ93_ZPchr0010g9228 [Zizania palustris]|uniref:Uncharacterized protein n=1 Tax=Zizania palustris TaxID=103762 RepID=A0A8J6BPC3_ZIZPA|nr:hypothetical protein GUJ93_ZPchr0010g9228 [Zizania palustris]